MRNCLCPWSDAVNMAVSVHTHFELSLHQSISAQIHHRLQDPKTSIAPSSAGRSAGSISLSLHTDERGVLYPRETSFSIKMAAQLETGVEWPEDLLGLWSLMVSIVVLMKAHSTLITVS